MKRVVNLTKLKMSNLKHYIRNISFFIVPRYPLANALTLLMLLAERAERDRYPFLEPNVIFGHLGMFVIVGIAMALNYGRKNATVLHAGQLLHLVYSLLSSSRLGYRNWVVIRMCTRLTGMSGMMILYAFFTMKKPRSYNLKRIGEILFGIYLGATTYLLMESPEDRKAFVQHMPGGEITLYIYALILACSALCYLPGLFVHDVSQACIILIFSSTLMVDFDIHYWVSRRGLDFWNHIRLLTDNMFIVVSLAMYLSCTKKEVAEDKKQD